MKTRAPSRPPGWAWAGLLAILLFDVWLRAHTFGPTLRDRFGLGLWPVGGAEGEPLDCDEAAYAYIGRRIVGGDVMYRDLTENKPPLGYWLYALAVALGGASELTIRVMPIPMVLATIALVWWIALRLAGPGAACLAAWTYAVVSTDPYLFGNGANLEHALNLLSVASLALMVAAWARPGRAPIGAAGALLGAATLVKPVAITHLPLYGLALLLRRPPEPGRARPTRGRLLDLAALGGGFALAWAAAISVLWLQGAGSVAFDDIVRLGGALATDTPRDPHAPPDVVRWFTGNADPNGVLPWPFGRTTYLAWWGTGSWPLWLASVPALAWLLAGPSTAPRRLLAGWTLSAWVQVALPRLFWQHYYLLPVPGLALAVAISTADTLSGARAALGRSAWARAFVSGLAGLVLVAALAATAAIQWRCYLMVPPQELTRYKGGHQWVVLRDLGRDLARRTRDWPSPHLYVWGWQSPLFIYSGLDSVTPHFFVNELMKAYADRDHPLIRPQIERILRDLRDRRPELIFAGNPPFPALRAFLFENYRPTHLGVSPDGRGLWVERSMYGRFEDGRSPGRPAIASPP